MYVAKKYWFNWYFGHWMFGHKFDVETMLRVFEPKCEEPHICPTEK